MNFNFYNFRNSKTLTYENYKKKAKNMDKYMKHDEKSANSRRMIKKYD
jgi:hypothetical protein